MERHRTMNVDHSSTGTRMRYSIPVAGALLAVREHGGSGPVVLLLHGGPGCPDYLEPVTRLLPPGLRAVTFDQRGVGGSSCEGDYRVEDHVADVEAVRLHLGAERVHLLGHSWGGLLAQLYTREHPEHVASLCLLNSSAGVGEEWAATEREVVAHNRRRSGRTGFAALGAWAAATYLPGALGELAGRRVFARVWRNYFPSGSTPPPADPSWLRGVNRVAAHRTAHAVRNAPASILDIPGTSPVRPVLSLYGDADIYGPSIKAVQARFPDGRHLVLRECGHLPWLQAPDALARSLAEFYGSAA
jgi:proline iminopeptidase